MPSLVLASGSPRRAALLSEGGFEFEIASPRVAEKFDAALTLRELTLWNAIRQGMSIAQMRPDTVVFSADTLVALENQIIGKPADLSEAAQMLRRLSGRTHEVCSAALIYHQTSGRSAVFHDISRSFSTPEQGNDRSLPCKSEPTGQSRRLCRAGRRRGNRRKNRRLIHQRCWPAYGKNGRHPRQIRHTAKLRLTDGSAIC